MSHHDEPSVSVPSNSLRYRRPSRPDKGQAQSLFLLLSLGFFIALAGLGAGFMYGDSFGRKHAQYDNPVLRDYYSGQCYAYWENQFKKTVRAALDRPTHDAEQNQRLEEIHAMLREMQQNIVELGAQAEARSKKKVVSTAWSPSNRLAP